MSVIPCAKAGRAILVALPALFILCIVSPSLAEDEVEFFFARYHDDAGLGVTTPSVIFRQDPLKVFSFSAKYIFEQFKKSAPENDVDAVSGATTVAGGVASGYQEDRHEAVLSGSYRKGNHSSTVSGFYGLEDDFVSRGASLAYSREFLQKNLSVTGVIGFGWDKIDVTNFEGSQHQEEKNNRSGTLVISQLLSKQAFFNIGYSLTRVEGFQSGPQRKVVVEEVVSNVRANYILDENHPESRSRHVMFARYKRYFLTRSSLDINLSHYRDSWGVKANALELSVSHYLNHEVILRVRQRWYQQDQADFYRTGYTQQQPLMTADARLRRFNAQLYGLKLSFLVDKNRLNDMSVDIALDRYRESNNGLTADILKLGFRMPF